MSTAKFEPTPRRLKRARQTGDNGKSLAFARNVSFVIAAAVVPITIRSLCRFGLQMWNRAADSLAQCDQSILFEPRSVLIEALTIGAPLLLIAGVGSILPQLLQSRGERAKRHRGHSASRPPFIGWERMGSIVLAFVETIAFVCIATVALKPTARSIGMLTGRPDFIAPILVSGIHTLAITAGTIGLVLGTVDVFLCHKAWRHRLRMTHDEIDRELREQSIQRRPEI